MNYQFEILKVTRQNMLKVVSNLSEEQLLDIPNGFNNNIIWNMGHVISASQRLCYTLAGCPMRVPENVVSMFMKGSAPKDWLSAPDISYIKELLVSTPVWLEQDYNNGAFKGYKEYQTSFGYTIKNIEEAISFANVHDGLHLGSIMALKKLV